VNKAPGFKTNGLKFIIWLQERQQPVNHLFASLRQGKGNKISIKISEHFED